MVDDHTHFKELVSFHAQQGSLILIVLCVCVAAGLTKHFSLPLSPPLSPNSGSDGASKRSENSVTSSPSCTPKSPREGSEVQSDDEQVKPPEDLVLATAGCINLDQKSSTQATSGDIPISPKSSPLSESSFPKISNVYSPEDHFPVESQTNTSLPVSVSPQEAKCFFPEPTTTQDYSVPSTSDAASSYYEATRNFYTSSSYPSTSYNAMFTGQSTESPLMAGGTMYSNSCVSPGYLSSYPAAAAGKSYAWSAASNGMGYGFGVTPTPDMYQYQAQTAAYQQMASRGSYPGYLTTGATAAVAVPHTIA